MFQSILELYVIAVVMVTVTTKLESHMFRHQKKSLLKYNKVTELHLAWMQMVLRYIHEVYPQ